MGRQIKFIPLNFTPNFTKKAIIEQHSAVISNYSCFHQRLADLCEENRTPRVLNGLRGTLPGGKDYPAGFLSNGNS